MKTEVRLNADVTATLLEGEDVPWPWKSPLLKLSSTQFSTEGLGGFGPPDEVFITGEEALDKLAELLSRRGK